MRIVTRSVYRRPLAHQAVLRLILLFMAVVLIPAAHAYGDDILNTKHNLSVSGPGTVKSSVEVEVCIFCHTPHKANPAMPPLWNRSLSQANYIPYQSSSLYATVGQPTGAAKLCLSCHDGTIALGALTSRPSEVPFEGGIRFMPPGPTLIGTDLSDDHPVSFVFDGQLAIANGQLHDPSILPEEVKLDRNGMVQCTSCHNPHGTGNPKFLVRTRSFSELCRSCHDKSGWGITSHSISAATWNGSGVDPWFHTPFDTVAENACENCHDPHSAGSDERILNYFFEEDICFACHNGNVASTNIEGIFSSRPYIHPIFDTVNVHDGPREDPLSMPKHVECMDCHNPHWANSSSPSGGAPAVSGRNQGVTGVSESGQSLTEAANLYEICFKCHADNNVKTEAPVNRLIFQLNTRLEFSPSNPGYHPVMAPGANPNVPSLRPPLTENSIIYCTDCHNNNDLSGPRGPHGSTNHFLLERQYVHQDFVSFDESRYAMCFKCHRWDTGNSGDLRDSETFEHKIHMENADASCFTCHDPHGVSSTQGNSLNNAHLINFNLDIVQPWTGGPRPDAPTYESLGQFRGRCTLECHGEQHGSGSSSRDNNGWREYPR